MNREKIEEIVREFLIEDLEVEEEMISPEASLKTHLTLLISWLLCRINSVSKLNRRKWDR